VNLLRDVLADELSASLKRLLTTHNPCTTNLYLLRLCKSVVSARGGELTGSWTPEQRLALGRKLVTVSSAFEIVPNNSLRCVWPKSPTHIASRRWEQKRLRPPSTCKARSLFGLETMAWAFERQQR
jgi:hypothetical protein